MFGSCSFTGLLTEKNVLGVDEILLLLSANSTGTGWRVAVTGTPYPGVIFNAEA